MTAQAIPARWYDRLEGMVVTTCSLEAEPSVTTSLGKLADQAALADVLNTLFEIHPWVVPVERLSAERHLLKGETT